MGTGAQRTVALLRAERVRVLEEVLALRPDDAAFAAFCFQQGYLVVDGKLAEKPRGTDAD